MSEMEKRYRLWEKDTFISYLEECLIPDLDESGNSVMAQDWRVAVKFMQNTGTNVINRNTLEVIW